jgi:hypothetical protein
MIRTILPVALAVCSGLHHRVGEPEEATSPCEATSPPDQGRARDPPGYAIVVSAATLAAWPAAVEALRRKHDGVVCTWSANVGEVRPRVAALMPRHACFVARPEEADREFVIAVHRLTRALDDDPYGDCLWGILTGYEEADLLRIVGRREPLTVRRGAGGTGVPLELFAEGSFWSECEQGVWWDKPPGGEATRKECAPDTTRALVAELNGGCDYFLTSGHATDRDWQIGFSYRNGQFRCSGGQLFGLDLEDRRHDVKATGPRIYSAAGNCLMGRIVDRDSMALAWIHSAGVDQMTGYVVSTWCGHGGWGVNDYFYLGIHSFAESFFLNNQSIVHRLESRFPKTARVDFDRWDIETDPGLIDKLAREHGITERDEAGLLWDRDTVAFYGDPAWVARLDRRAERPFEQRLVEADGVFTFEVVATADGEWQRFPAALLPRRVRDAAVLEGDGLVTDDFVLLPLTGRHTKGDKHRLRFRASQVPGVPRTQGAYLGGRSQTSSTRRTR